MKTYQWVLLTIGVAVLVLGSGVALVALAFWHGVPQGAAPAEVELPQPVGDAVDPEDGVTVIAHSAIGDADKGRLGSIVVRTKKGRSNIPAADWRPRLVEELRQLRKDGDVKDHVRIEAEKRVQWASVVAIMDACREAGFQNVGFAPPPDQ